jgi:hypothetical protein
MLKLGLLIVAITVLGSAVSGQELVWKERAELPRPRGVDQRGLSQK